MKAASIKQIVLYHKSDFISKVKISSTRKMFEKVTQPDEKLLKNSLPNVPLEQVAGRIIFLQLAGNILK